MQLNMLSRSLSRILLKVARTKAQQRGADLHFAIGDEGTGQNPHIAVPVMGAYRMFRSDEPMTLPITWEGKKGTWHRNASGDWTAIERGENFLDTSHWFTFVINTAHIDWHRWKVENIPAVSELDLGLFWGRQACHGLLFDEGGQDRHHPRRIFFDLELSPPHRRPSATGSRCGLTKVNLQTNEGSPPVTGTPDSGEVWLEAVDDEEDQIQLHTDSTDFARQQSETVVDAQEGMSAKRISSAPGPELDSPKKASGNQRSWVACCAMGG